MTPHRPRPGAALRLPAATLALVGVLVSGCAAAQGTAATKADRTASSTSAPGEGTTGTTHAPSAAPVATEPVQIPPVPLIEIPDLAPLDEAQQSLTSALDDAVAELVDATAMTGSGLTVVPARCDAAGDVVRDDATALYGDGSGSFVDADGTTSTWNYGDGSGATFTDTEEVRNYGDGSGSYISGEVEIYSYNDGSGTYISGGTEIRSYGDGSGSHLSDDLEIRNYGDGSGSYLADDVEIRNYGDGTGSYFTDDVEMWNDGDGTGRVDGVTVPMEPLPPLPPLGVFPPLPALEPLAPTCGTLVTLPGGVLFDFGSDALRPEASAVLDAVAGALTGPGARVATVTISGHTDSVGSDEFNLDLSQRRAEQVSTALAARGASQTLDPIGLGESQPVAANEIDGVDNPAGRQLNRRVEIFIPSA